MQIIPRSRRSRSIYSSLLAIGLLFSSHARATQLIAFERGHAIWVANADGSKARKIGNGSAPSVSPDGTRIAFQLRSPGGGDLTSRIAITQIADGKTTVLKEQIPSDRCQRPTWSPDGKQILFELETNENWHIAIINADGTSFHYVRKASSFSETLYSACWSSDGRSIYAHDLQSLYQVGLDGKELKKWSLPALLPSFSLTSATHIDPSPDGKTILIDAESETEPVTAPNWDGLAILLWSIDLASEKATRLTPEGLMAWHGCWVNSDEVVFASQSAKEKKPAIYRMKLPEKDSRLLIKGADNPSVARESR
jgi:TolB protein